MKLMKASWDVIVVMIVKLIRPFIKQYAREWVKSTENTYDDVALEAIISFLDSL